MHFNYVRTVVLHDRQSETLEILAHRPGVNLCSHHRDLAARLCGPSVAEGSSFAVSIGTRAMTYGQRFRRCELRVDRGALPVSSHRRTFSIKARPSKVTAAPDLARAGSSIETFPSASTAATAHNHP